MVLSACSPVNGGRPVKRSNKTAPKLYTSAEAVSLPSDPFTCSGAIYPGVPKMLGVRVKRPFGSNHLPTPKSLTIVSSRPSNKMFPGLRSRGTNGQRLRVSQMVGADRTFDTYAQHLR